MRISDWSSDVCSSDLAGRWRLRSRRLYRLSGRVSRTYRAGDAHARGLPALGAVPRRDRADERRSQSLPPENADDDGRRTEEHTSELQSLMRISYAVFCLKKKTKYLARSTRPSTTAS